MRYLRIVWLLAGAYFALDLAVGLSIHDWNFIDENVYALASAKILLHQSCSILYLNIPTACNYEHPPLSKALGAISLYIFGGRIESSSAIFDAEYLSTLVTLSSSPLWFLSFRFFQLVMGALSLVLVYVIASKISGNQTLALATSGLLFLEPLYAFFSRTDYLDIPMIFFALCAYAVFFSRLRLGPLDEYVLSGAMLGLSILCKESGVVFIVPLVAYHLIFGESRPAVRAKESLLVLLGMAVVGAAGLQLYDSFGNTPFPNILDQITYMFEYSRSIACHGGCLFSPGPTSWFAFFIPTRWSDGFSGNQILLWLVLAWIPLGAYLVRKERRSGLVSPESRLFVFASLLFAATFLENELIYLSGRKTWIYYYLIVVPSVSFGGGYLLTRPQLAAWIRATIVALVLLGYFWAYLAGPSFLLYD